MAHLSPAEPQDFLPLTHLSYHVLLSLAGTELHGYGIIKEVSERTDGMMELETGTLYTAIRRLQAEGLLEVADRDPAPGEDRRRRYYQLTSLGGLVLSAESERLVALIRIAREKRVIEPTPNPAS